MSQAGGDAETLGVVVWRGGVNTWECDEMGHMNVRFYVARALEGLAGLGAELGLPHAFSPAANATLLLRETHLRFMREARAMASLHMRGWVLEMRETDADLLLVLYHTFTGAPSASFRMRVAHVTPGHDGRAFPWPPHARERAAALTAGLPHYAAPRSLDLGPVETMADLEWARDRGMTMLTMGVFGAQDCDAFGRMRADQFMGRVSDGLSSLTGPLKAEVRETLEPKPERLGGAVIEIRLIHHRWPRAGDRFVIYSGLAEASERTFRLVHWMLDPDGGGPYGSALATNVHLDLEARKLLPSPPAAQAVMQRRVIAGLDL